MSARIEPLLTVDDLDLLPDDGNRYELIEGEIVVSCAPGIPHQLVVSNLDFAFRMYLETNPIGIIVPGPGVIFSRFSGVIPDLVFLTNERRAEIASGEKVMGAPDLVIEIISPGQDNARRDREVKRQLYARYGVREYWIVNPEERAVEAYRLGKRSLRLTATLRDEDDLTSPLLPGFKLSVAHIFKI